MWEAFDSTSGTTGIKWETRGFQDIADRVEAVRAGETPSDWTSTEAALYVLTGSPDFSHIRVEAGR